MSDQTRNAPAAATYALAVLGVLFAVAGVIYLMRTANDLPSFFPGHQAGSSHTHTKHGIGMFVLALVSWVAAYFTTGTKPATAA